MQKNSGKISDRTKIPRMQLFRMARIVSLLKKNRMPDAESLLKEYEKLEFDLLYINHMSVVTDLQLMFSTAGILFSKESTAGVEGTTAIDYEEK